MSIYVETHVVCDRCGSTLTCHTYAKKIATARARQKCWSVGKKVLCPVCNGRFSQRRSEE